MTRVTSKDLGFIQAELTMRRTEDGGRQIPIRSGYRPNWWLPGEADHVWTGGSVELIDVDELDPGAAATVRIYPFVPEVWANLEVGTPLEMCEGPVLIGKATVTQVALITATAGVA